MPLVLKQYPEVDNNFEFQRIEIDLIYKVTSNYPEQRHTHWDTAKSRQTDRERSHSFLLEI